MNTKKSANPERLRMTVLACAFAVGAGASTASSQTAATAWMPLFDGKDLASWGYDSEYWGVDSGMVEGQGKAAVNVFCHTTRKFSDFVLTVRARLWQTSAGYTNSGIQYRSAFIDSATHRMEGYQVDIGDGLDGSMWPEAGYPAGANQVLGDPCRKFIHQNDWNQFLVIADSGKVRHELNGNVCLEYTASVLDGYIGFQLHATAQVMKVDFKDVFIRPLNNSFAIPASQAVYLNDVFALSVAPVLADTRSGPTLSGRTLRVPAGYWVAHPGEMVLSLSDMNGRTLYACGVTAGASVIELPALGAGHILRMQASGGGPADALRTTL